VPHSLSLFLGSLGGVSLEVSLEVSLGGVPRRCPRGVSRVFLGGVPEVSLEVSPEVSQRCL